ncbi:MAG: LCP family protein [Dermatophilaceae bacterium]
MTCLAVLAISGTAYAVYLGTLVGSNVTTDDLMPSTPVPTDRQQAISGAAAAAASATDPSDLPASSLPVKLPEAGTNILLIGSDNYSTQAGRSDVIILAHVNEAKDHISLIHFPRDLYVSIEGHGKGKINAAYAYGGAPLLVDTVQRQLGVVIDNVAMTGFDGFRAMTDAVGGVDVEVTEASSSFGHSFTPGVTHMSGEEALAFVRERKQLSEGDISRGQRQQAFLKALLLKSLSRDTLTNPVQLARFIDAATQNLTVDRGLGVNEMRTLAFDLLGIRSGDISFVTAPFASFATVANVGDVELLDAPAMRALGDAVRSDRLSEYTR